MFRYLQRQAPSWLNQTWLEFSVTVEAFWYLIISEGKLIHQLAQWLCHSSLGAAQHLAICIHPQMDLSSEHIRVEPSHPSLTPHSICSQASSGFNDQLAQLSPHRLTDLYIWRWLLKYNLFNPSVWFRELNSKANGAFRNPSQETNSSWLCDYSTERYMPNNTVYLNCMVFLLQQVTGKV